MFVRLLSIDHASNEHGGYRLHSEGVKRVAHYESVTLLSSLCCFVPMLRSNTLRYSRCAPPPKLACLGHSSIRPSLMLTGSESHNLFPYVMPFWQKCWREYKKRLSSALIEAHARADAAACTIQAAYYRYHKKVSVQRLLIHLAD